MAYDKDYKPSDNSERETPDDLFNLLDKEFNFYLDVAASAENTKCSKYFDKEADALVKSWTPVSRDFSSTSRYGGDKSAWLNPPYSRGVINRFVERARFYGSQPGMRVVCLLPARTAARWWHKHVVGYDSEVQCHAEIRFLVPRVKFLMNGKPMSGGAMTPNAVVIFTNGSGYSTHWWDWKEAIKFTDEWMKKLKGERNE